MLVHVAYKAAELIAQEKAYGQPRCVRSNSKHIIRPFRVYFQFIAILAFRYSLYRRVKVGVAQSGVVIVPEHPHIGQPVILFLRSFSPAYNGSVAYAVHVFLIGQQIIQRGCVCKRRVFADRRIVVLLLPV